MRLPSRRERSLQNRHDTSAYLDAVDCRAGTLHVHGEKAGTSHLYALVNGHFYFSITLDEPVMHQVGAERTSCRSRRRILDNADVFKAQHARVELIRRACGSKDVDTG